MAFGKKKHRGVKTFLILIFLIIVIAGVLVSGMIFYQTKVKLLKEGYEEKIQSLLTEADNLKKKVWVSSGDLAAGVQIKKEQFMFKEISSNLDNNLFITEEDFGKILLVDLRADSPVLKSMIFDEGVADDEREEELNMLFIPSNLKKNQYVDVRIAFSNGEDYIVLSKMKARNVNIESNTIWLWMNEKQILTLRSAVVDAYLHKGTKLYTVTYVAPSIQPDALVNYPVNVDVLRVIKENPNIFDEAKAALTGEVRLALDERLNKLKNEDVSSVEQGVKEEINNHEAAVNDSLSENNTTEDSSQEENIDEVIIEGTSETKETNQGDLTKSNITTDTNEEAKSNGFY